MCGRKLGGAEKRCMRNSSPGHTFLVLYNHKGFAVACVPISSYPCLLSLEGRAVKNSKLISNLPEDQEDSMIYLDTFSSFLGESDSRAWRARALRMQLCTEKNAVTSRSFGNASVDSAVKGTQKSASKFASGWKL